MQNSQRNGPLNYFYSGLFSPAINYENLAGVNGTARLRRVVAGFEIVNVNYPDQYGKQIPSWSMSPRIM
jgi:hypothetical protein